MSAQNISGAAGHAAQISRIPDQAGIIRDALASLEIPIRGVLKPRDVTVEKNKLRALIVQGGMDVVLLRHRREITLAFVVNAFANTREKRQPAVGSS